MDSLEYSSASESARIESQIQATKRALSEKVEELQIEVASTLVSAETMVTSSVESTVERVKNVFSLRHQVQCNPVAFMAGSVALGMLASKILVQTIPQTMKSNTANETTNDKISGDETEVIQSPSMVSKLGDMIRGELKNLKGLSLGILFGTIRELTLESIPSHLSKNVGSIFDDATREVGGRVIERSQHRSN